MRQGDIPLKVNHPALTEGRTIFPSTVVSPRDTERLLVSGHNNPKLGAEVRKGPWKGFPIYHLTLEERASCPRSCALWAGCYGNAMHLARRHDHRDPDFLVLLEMELTATAGKHPFGFAIRLHTLGDFYSEEYGEFWVSMLEEFTSLHLFGFTAHANDSDIGALVERMNVSYPTRSYIRFSGLRGGAGSVVFDDAPPRGSAEGAGIIMCPAQTGETAACATCGICWSDAAWDKCIGFMKHGMKARRYAKPKQLEAVRENASKLMQKITPKPGHKTPLYSNAIQSKGPDRAPSGPPSAPLSAPPFTQPPPPDERGVVRLQYKPKKLGISREEQDRLIAEALEVKTVTVCPPARAGS